MTLLNSSGAKSAKENGENSRREISVAGRIGNYTSTKDDFLSKLVFLLF